MMRVHTKPLGVFCIAIFLGIATLILVCVGSALLCPGSWLEAVWQLYPVRRALLMPHRAWLGPAFLGLALAMALASAGCLRHRPSGWYLAVAIFAANGFGDAVQLWLGHYLEGAIGVTAAGALLFYLSRPTVRSHFSR